MDDAEREINDALKDPNSREYNVFNGIEVIHDIPTGDQRVIKVPLTMDFEGHIEQIGWATTKDGEEFEVDIEDALLPKVAHFLGAAPMDDTNKPPFTISYVPDKEARIVPRGDTYELMADDQVVATVHVGDEVPKQYPLVAHLGGEIVEIGFAEVYESGRIVPTVTDTELADICRYDVNMPEWMLILTDDDGSGEREVVVEPNPAFAEPKNVADVQKPAVIDMGVWDQKPESLREYAELFQKAPMHFLGVLTTLEDAIQNQKADLIMPAYLRIDEMFKVLATRLIEVAEGLEVMEKEENEHSEVDEESAGSPREN